MLRIGKVYTGKLESTFAFASSKRLVAVEKDLRKLFKGTSFQSEEHFLSSSFTPAMKSFVLAVKNAVNGDFAEVDIRIYEVRKLSIHLVQLMKGSYGQSQMGYNFNEDVGYDLETHVFLRSSPRAGTTPTTRNQISSDSVPTTSPSDKKKTRPITSTSLDQNKLRESKVKPRPQSVSLLRGFPDDLSYLTPTSEMDLQFMEKSVLEFQEKWKCISCSTQNKDHRIVCSNCGTTKFDSKHTKNVPDVVDDDVWYCKKCTVPHPSSKIMCDSCGAKPENLVLKNSSDEPKMSSNPKREPRRSFTVNDKSPKW